MIRIGSRELVKHVKSMRLSYRLHHRIRLEVSPAVEYVPLRHGCGGNPGVAHECPAGHSVQLVELQLE